MACDWFKVGRARKQAKDAAATVPLAPTTSVNPRVIQVTTPTDGQFVNRMYSYWANAVVLGEYAFVFAGHVDEHPRFFKVELASGTVEPLGPKLPYRGTSEGWYWDRDGWIYVLDGPRLRRVNPFTGEDRVVFDISDAQPGCRLWQAHSSEDGQVHSATVQRVVSDGAYPNIGTVVHRHGQTVFYGANGLLDESQIDADGQFLIIKEDDDNRIVDLATDNERLLTDADGAVGHSDVGRGFMVGENDRIGSCDYVDLRTLQRRHLFASWNMGYVAVRGTACLHSGETTINLVALDGSAFVPLVEHGGGQDYDSRVKANLSPCGRVGCYMSQGTVYLIVL